jgi:acyl-CoA hydrolase
VIEETSETVREFEVTGGASALSVTTDDGRMATVNDALPERLGEGQTATTDAYRHEVRDPDGDRSAAVVFAASAGAARAAAEEGDHVVVPTTASDPRLAVSHDVAAVRPEQTVGVTATERGVVVVANEEAEDRGRGR